MSVRSIRSYLFSDSVIIQLQHAFFFLESFGGKVRFRNFYLGCESSWTGEFVSIFDVLDIVRLPMRRSHSHCHLYTGIRSSLCLWFVLFQFSPIGEIFFCPQFFFHIFFSYFFSFSVQ